MAGRPTKLTPELTEQICNDLREGAYVETAAEAAGITQTSLYRWLDWGAQGKEPYAAFCESVVRARADGELALLRAVRAGDERGQSFGQARAAAFVLERTRPNRYAQRVNMKIDDAVTQVMEIVRGVCSEQDFARICERLEAVDREGGEQLPAADPGEPTDSLH